MTFYHLTDHIEYIFAIKIIRLYCPTTVLFDIHVSRQIKALVCGESHQYWFIALMMTFMPWLFLFSASFMLLTLTTYCAIPTLRRTMHGFTLCCHLISMTTHFIGLATIYSNIISLTRFTCLFFGKNLRYLFSSICLIKDF